MIEEVKIIKSFLLEKKGYLKEGASRLKKILMNKGIEVSKEACKEALKQVRKEIKEEYIIDSDPYDSEDDLFKSNLVLKSRWQNASGKWLESYKNDINDKLEIFSSLKEELLEDLKTITKPKITKLRDNVGDILYEISLPDYHFGKDDGRTIKKQLDDYVYSVARLHKKAESIGISKFLLPVGNDLFNSDNLEYTTTKGTPQKDNSQWQLSFRAGTLAVIKSVNYLLQFAPVDIVIVQGNHDYQKSFYLGEIINAYFLGNKDVNVNNNINSPRKYYQYGNCLLGFTHGDKEKPQDLPLLMAVEEPIAFSKTIYKEWHIGHIHKHVHDEYQGIGVKVLPSLCGQDEWHKKMGYTSKRKAQAYIWNFVTGLEGFLQINN